MELKGGGDGVMIIRVHVDENPFNGIERHSPGLHDMSMCMSLTLNPFNGIERYTWSPYT